MSRKRTALFVTSLYLITAAFVLLRFFFSPPDGLANLWIGVWTFPVTLTGLALLSWPFGIGFPFVPSTGLLGYYGSHAVYFVAAVSALSAAMFRLIAGKDT